LTAIDGKVVAPFQYSGTTDSVLFERWTENQPLPAVAEGATTVLDRASFRRKSVLHETAESKNRRLEYLPAYSPDLNPIERTLWANVKSFLCNYSDALMDFFQFK
jgi:transposase